MSNCDLDLNLANSQIFKKSDISNIPCPRRVIVKTVEIQV